MMAKRGLMGLAVIVVLALAAAIALIYWKMSSQDLFMVFREGEKLKAVNLAESGLNYAVEMLNESYYSGKWPVQSPGPSHPKVRKEFENGSFTIEDIHPARELPLDGRIMDKFFFHQPYRNGYGTISGFYDIYSVTVVARMNASGVSVKLSSLVKTIQLEKK
ncbi:MAG: hypothetical protein PHW04_10080 [Candidatus Wallbacteria bacterium]|nr:hypothetical protein [Candidatus Wallbacteria bacterium]